MICIHVGRAAERALLVTDETGCIVHASAAAANMLGFKWVKGWVWRSMRDGVGEGGRPKMLGFKCACM